MSDEKKTEGIGAELRAARTRRKLTEQQLATKLGVSQEFIAMVELGTKAPPDSMLPLLRRFIDSGRTPTSDELSARKNRRTA
jgi:transcriptional regulator with XRE-family HTH domain